MDRTSRWTLALLALITAALPGSPARSEEPDLEGRAALMSDAEPVAQDDLVTLDSFDQFVEAFNGYEEVPRIVLLLSPT